MPKRGYLNTSRKIKIKFSLTYLSWRKSSSKTVPVIIRGRKLPMNHFQPSPLVTHHVPLPSIPPHTPNCWWPTFSITTANKSSWFGLTHLKNTNIITIQTSDAENLVVVRQLCWFPVYIFFIVMGIVVFLYFGNKYYFRESNIIFIKTILQNSYYSKL